MTEEIGGLPMAIKYRHDATHIVKEHHPAGELSVYGTRTDGMRRCEVLIA